MAEKYFLGSFSPKGFKGNFKEIIDGDGWKTIILKGGAGTGKSSLMKKISKHFESTDEVAEFYCSSDPSSLDAVLLAKRKRIIVDGTAPHTFDPVFPGVKQKLINLGDFWDEKKLLENACEIMEITSEHKKCMERTQRYVRALSAVFCDTYSIAEEAVLSQKLGGFIDRFTKKLSIKKSSPVKKITSMQLSALTPEGYKTMLSTIKDYEVYLLRDNYFAGSDIILKELAEIFSARGKEVFASECRIFENSVYEHIIVPEMKLAFVTANPLTALKLENVKPINVGRFYDKKILSQRMSWLRLNKKACSDLTGEACKTMKNALKIHDRLEKYYIDAMDFGRVNKKCREIISDFEAE